MKKICITLLICFIVKIAGAQISISTDSIANVLCHKWGFKAILMGGQKITNMNESVTYEFLTDGSFIRVTSDGKTDNGKWNYKADSNIIILKIKKKYLHIPVLSKDELIVAPGDGLDQSNNSLGIGTILKPIDVK